LNIEPGALAAIAFAVAGVLSAVGVWIRMRSEIATMQQGATQSRDEWERQTITALTNRYDAIIQDATAVLNAEVLRLQTRIEKLDKEIGQLREDGREKDKTINGLRDRVQKLEIENARLLAQREARDDQIELLKQQIDLLQQPVMSVLQLTAEIGTFMRAYGKPGDCADAADAA